MKMKPSQRNAVQNTAKEAEREIRRLEASLAKFTPGSPPHSMLAAKLDEARSKLGGAKARLSHTTQPK